MTRPRALSLWADRLERAFLILAGALLLGPLVPGGLLALGAALGRLVPDGAGSVPALPFAPAARDILLASYFDGGGLAALLSGACIGLAVLWRGSIGAGPAVLLVVFFAALVAAGRLHGIPLRYAAAQVLAFALVAAATAGLLIAATARLRLLAGPDFPLGSGEARVPPR